MALERALNQPGPGRGSRQAGKRDRAPELMRGQPAWRVNATYKLQPDCADAQAGMRDRAPEPMRGKLRGA